MTPAVSIVLPFHNAEATLAEALRSLCAQTLSNFEIIAVDDGSTDGAAAVVTRLAAEDGRIRVLRPGRVGIVGALCAGCDAARGRYIGRMDADDVALPGRLAAQKALLDRDGSLGLCGTRVRVEGPAAGQGARRYMDWINTLIAPADIAREIFVECPVPHPTFMLRRAAFEAVGGYRDMGWAEDYDLVLRLHCAGYAIGKTPEVLLLWRDTAQRLSRNDPRYSPAAFRACKRAYLFQGPLAARRRLFQWGAGGVGKHWLREWGDRAPEAVVDINPRKLGLRIHGVPVIEREALPPPGAAVTVVAVGAPGAREEIRAWFTGRGYRELADFVFVA